MSSIRFYVDEHIAHSVVAGLRRRGIDVMTTDQAGLRGATDERQLRQANEQHLVLVTKDDDFLRLHAEGVRHSGIVFIPAQATIGTIVQGLVLIHSVLDAEVLQNHVEFL